MDDAPIGPIVSGNTPENQWSRERYRRYNASEKGKRRRMKLRDGTSAQAAHKRKYQDTYPEYFRCMQKRAYWYWMINRAETPLQRASAWAGLACNEIDITRLVEAGKAPGRRAHAR